MTSSAASTTIERVLGSHGTHGTGRPLLIVVGSNDEYCPTEVVERLRAERPQATFNVIEGANHFFFGKLYPLGEALGAWLAPTLTTLGTGQARRSGSTG